MRRCLIDGAAGFVGRAFTRHLTRAGWEVVALDNMSAGIEPKAWHAPVQAWSWRVSPQWDVRRGVATMGHPDDYDLVIHCAAIVGGRLKIDGDPLAVAVDLEIDAAFFRWVVGARPGGEGKQDRKPLVVYFSSSAVYPIELQGVKYHTALAEGLVHHDATRFGAPDQTYGLSKFVGERLAQTAVRQYGARILTYRPFSGYGEDQSFDYPFPSIIRRVVNREDPLVVWGSGDQCRDFIHIDDIVEAVMQTKDVLAPGDVLNLGSGEATSFKQLVYQVNTVLYGFEGKHTVQTDTTKPEGVFYRVADTYKMHQFYKPKISLEEGIRRVAAHLTKAKDIV